MPISTSPRKTIPLATGEEPYVRPESTAFSTTKRVFFASVVVEGSEGGKRLPEDIQDLVLSLGDLQTDNALPPPSSASDPSPAEHEQQTRKRALADSSALASLIKELVNTERSYVTRLQSLKNDYADPLRSFARKKATALIPQYQANTLFGNIDNLLPVNEAFLQDLEKMMLSQGPSLVGGIGDVALKHFKELRGFEQYKHFYVKRGEAQEFFEKEMSKKSSRFGDFIDRVKYQFPDARNRVGLRELLMEPVQRIPRYTLLFRNMIKHMAPGDPQRAKLIEADAIASKIALAEADEQTKRAAIFSCLHSSIEGFPAELFSNSRRFIDCIDVEDVISDLPISSSTSMSSSSALILHCTLFLFDDKLVIVKRSNNEKGGRALCGLDSLDKVTKGTGLLNGKRKTGMSCRGVVDVSDVVATDVDGADFQLYLESPPFDQGDRWSGRPFRSLAVVHPPSPVNLDPPQTEMDKRRFLENLWDVQAKYRTKAGQSVVLRSEDVEVGSERGKVTLARTYYNVYQRTAFLQEKKKTKVVVHIDASGTADVIPFGEEGPPFVMIRLQPLPGGLCTYKVTSRNPDSSDGEINEDESDAVHTPRVPFRIMFTVHQFGLFEYRAGRSSRPSTPTSRSKASMFGLDAISRRLFNARSDSSMGDFFAGSVSSHKRIKSTASRSSVFTQSTNTDSSLMKFSHRSNSTATSATTVDDDSSFFARSPPKSKKLLKRGVSPGASDSEGGSLRRSLSRSQSRSRSVSRDRDSNYSDVEEPDRALLDRYMNSSDHHLEKQLDLARKNSKNQVERRAGMALEPPAEGTIYEDEPPPLRPSSRASRDSNSQCTVTQSLLDSPMRRSRSLSRHSSDRRPMGPRTPSPLPPQKSPLSPETLTPPAADNGAGPSGHHHNTPNTPARFTTTTGIPRSTMRLPLRSTENTDATPKPISADLTGSSVEPLSIKKKSYPVTPTGLARSKNQNLVRTSPLSRTTARIASPRRVSPRTIRTAPHQSSSTQTESFDTALQLSLTTKEDVDSSHRAVKRIRLELDSFRTRVAQSPIEHVYPSRPSSPSKGFHTPQHEGPPSQPRERQQRMDELQQLINMRQGKGTPRSVFLNGGDHTPSRLGSSPERNTLSLSVDALLADVDRDLSRAVSNHDALQGTLKQLGAAFKERSNEIEKVKLELQNSRRQCEAVKMLLEENTKEKDIMYEAFNEELDNMFNDVNLPDDEAWTGMTTDLRETKESRNALSRENSLLKQRLTELELQQEEWGALLRSHNLIS